MVFKQFYLSCLAHASYLIGDEATGAAVVVDPQRDVDQYISFAAPLLASAEPPLAVDVRTAREREQSSISGSVSLPLNNLLAGLGSLPKDRPLLLYCAGGYRSSIAASLLARNGFERLSEIAGGIAAWEASGLSLAGTTRSP